MNSNRIYLDHNATTPVLPEVRQKLNHISEAFYGNASSIHHEGAESRRLLEESREMIASLVGAHPEEILFTSGGSEGNTFLLQGAVKVWREKHPNKPVEILANPLEHSSVLRNLDYLVSQQADVLWMRVQKDGSIDTDNFVEQCEQSPALMTLHWANNETGLIYPVESFAEKAKANGILCHVDAVQALGKIPFSLAKTNIDLMTFSGHKIYTPKGVGFVFVKKGVKVSPLIFGGPQEREKRAGTENVPAIAAMALALSLASQCLSQEMERLSRLRDKLENGLMKSIPSLFIYGKNQERLSNTSLISFPKVAGEMMVLLLDREGIAVSSGSACASGATEPSHVLLAMGVPQDIAKNAVRFSLGKDTTDAAIDTTIETITRVYNRIKK